MPRNPSFWTGSSRLGSTALSTIFPGVEHNFAANGPAFRPPGRSLVRGHTHGIQWP